MCPLMTCCLFADLNIPVGHPRRGRRRHRSTSPASVQSPSRREFCRNCGVRTQNEVTLCHRCSPLPKCRTCKRHLQPVHFEDGSDRCRACQKKVRSARHAGGSAVIEYDLEVLQHEDLSYEEYVNENADIINRIVQENQRQHR